MICGIIAIVLDIIAALVNSKNPPYAKTSTEILSAKEKNQSKETIGIYDALLYKKVAAYAAISFFLKFAHYGYLFWLPYYIKNGLHYPDKTAVAILTLYDIGYFAGSFLTGYLSDLFKSRQAVLNIGTGLSLIIAVVNQYYIDSGDVQFILIPMLGLTVGGTLILLCTACATDLVII